MFFLGLSQRIITIMQLVKRGLFLCFYMFVRFIHKNAAAVVVLQLEDAFICLDSSHLYKFADKKLDERGTPA